MQSKPMNVMPCWCLRIKSSLKEPLFNLIPDPSPERSVTSIKIKPDSNRFSDQILRRNEPRRIWFVEPAAILTVIAVVAHEEIVPRGHHPFPRLHAAIREHDAMTLGIQLFEGRGNARIVPQIRLRPGISRAGSLHHGLAVDVELVVLIDTDAVAGQPHQTLDVVDLRIRRQAEHDHIAALRGARGE